MRKKLRWRGSEWPSCGFMSCVSAQSTGGRSGGGVSRDLTNGVSRPTTGLTAVVRRSSLSFDWRAMLARRRFSEAAMDTLSRCFVFCFCSVREGVVVKGARRRAGGVSARV